MRLREHAYFPKDIKTLMDEQLNIPCQCKNEVSSHKTNGRINDVKVCKTPVNIRKTCTCMPNIAWEVFETIMAVGGLRGYHPFFNKNPCFRPYSHKHQQEELFSPSQRKTI